MSENTLSIEQLDILMERIHTAVVNFLQPPDIVDWASDNLVLPDALKEPRTFRVGDVVKWLDAEEAVWMRDWIDIGIGRNPFGRSFEDAEIDLLPISIPSQKTGSNEIYTLAVKWDGFRDKPAEKDGRAVVYKSVASWTLFVAIDHRVGNRPGTVAA